jgi:aryl-alcohol dehydrogenase-like predicted oxidoreductase
MEAVDNSLRRLKTDYIDLLYIHWPDRYLPLYGEPKYDPSREYSDSTPILEQVEIMNELIKAGKIRHYGLCNESPYGVTRFAVEAERSNLIKPCVSQNIYNLLSRNDVENGLVETCSASNAAVGLIASSPLAGGALSGKYIDPKVSVTTKLNSRLRRYLGYMYRYNTEQAQECIREYMKVAEEYDIPLSVIAIAFVASQPFVTSTVIGATNSEQLEANAQSAAHEMVISESVIQQLDQVHKKYVEVAKGDFEVIDPVMDAKRAHFLKTMNWGEPHESIDNDMAKAITARGWQWDEDENDQSLASD